MGALHEGHLALMRRAKAESGFCVASIFVNPKQFGPTEDFAKYPRPESKDFELAQAAGVDVMFAPTVDEMYPMSVTTVHLSGVTERWEGESRPGHFDGVTTVVAKLFNIIRPTHAYFGWKDFQQCVVIERMVKDLNIPVSLRFAETIREPDGLARSSRNVYLSEEHRAVAPQLYRVLLRSAQHVKQEETVDVCLEESIGELTGLGFEVHYFALVDRSTLERLSESRQDARIIAAVKLGNTRLIDNVSIE